MLPNVGDAIVLHAYRGASNPKTQRMLTADMMMVVRAVDPTEEGAIVTGQHIDWAGYIRKKREVYLRADCTVAWSYVDLATAGIEIEQAVAAVRRKL